MVVKVNFLKVQWEKEAKSSAPVRTVAFASQTRRIYGSETENFNC